MDATQDYLVLIFLILLIVFNINITQSLPAKVQQILRNPITKILIITLVFIFAIKYPSIALLLLIAYVLSHSYSQTSNVSDDIVSLAPKPTEPPTGS